MRASAPLALVVSLIAVAGFPGKPLVAQSISMRVDSARHEVVIEAGPFDVPAMDPEMAKEMEHAAMNHEEERRVFRFDWPVDGPARTFRVEIRDASGAPLPRALLHH